MDKSFDDQIKKKLMQDVEPLPVSYTERITALLEELQEKEKKPPIKFNVRYAAVILVLFLLGASGTHAAVSVYQQQLSAVSNVGKEKLDKKTQKKLNDSDHFSRDYEVKEKNSQKQELVEEETVSQKEAVKIAKNILRRIYKLDMENAEIIVEFDSAEVSDEEAIPSHLISFTAKSLGGDVGVKVDVEEGIVKGITIDDMSKEECVSGIKADEDRCRECSDNIYPLLSVLGEEENVDEIRFIYRYRKDGTLNRGNVKYLVKLKDESAYVFLYSFNTKTIYKLYKMSKYTDALKQEKENEKVQKQRGIMTKNKVITK